MSGVEEEEELKRSSVSNEFSVGYLHLSCFPMKLFMNANFEGLRQLDISYNSIVILPRELGKLQNLRSLWINNNPILLLPIEIASLQRLEILDMRNTKIAEVPLAIAVLKDLYDLDWRGTPMACNLQSKYDIAPGDLQMLRDFLQKIHEREEIEKDFLDLLRNKKFVTESVSFANFDELSNEAVGIISALFEDLADLRMFLRRADKFLPALLTDFTAKILEQSKSAFTKFQRDSQRTYLAADLEIKIRGIFFDRIERNSVVSMIDSIYRHVQTLEDILFLLKYATTVLPASPDDADCGAAVLSNIQILQAELTRKRETAVGLVAQAMSHLYPEQQEDKVHDMASAVCAALQNDRFATKRELNNLTLLAADSAKIFPPDFASVTPQNVATAAQARIFNSRTS